MARYDLIEPLALAADPTGRTPPAGSRYFNTLLGIDRAYNGTRWIDLCSTSQVYDARRFGVVADGATNNTTALQNAVNQISSDGGGMLLLPRGTIIGSVVLPAKVILAGHGRMTILKAPASFNGSVVSLTSTAWGVGIRDLMIDGNYTNVTASNGIYLSTNGEVQSVDPTLYGGTAPDPIPHLFNVEVQFCKGTGVFVGVNMREIKAWNVYVLYCDIGFDVVSHDAFFTNCSVGGTRYECFRENGRNNHYVGCKAFYAGQAPDTGLTVTGRAYGWRIQGIATQLTACETQENADVGVLLDGPTGSTLLTEVQITGHLFGGDRLYALHVKNRVARCVVSGVIAVANRYTTGSGIAWDAVPAAFENVIRIHTASGIDYNTGVPFVFLNSGEMRGSQIEMNCQRAISVQSGISTLTPTPTNAEVYSIFLDRNLTINNPSTSYTAPGMELEFVFQQDGTGGRTVTWGSQFVLNWTPVTLATKRNSIRFRNVGTSSTPLWVQIAGQTNI